MRRGIVSPAGAPRHPGREPSRSSENSPTDDGPEFHAQAPGSGNRYIEPQVGEIQCEPGDRLLLCTDGVTGGLWDHALEELIRTPPAAISDVAPALRIVRAAVAESDRDNATALVIEAG